MVDVRGITVELVKRCEEVNVRDHEGPKGREMQRGRQKRQADEGKARWRKVAAELDGT